MRSGATAFPRTLKTRLAHAYELFTPQNKLKILIGFYMIATQIGRVYEVRFPDDVQTVLVGLSTLATFGRRLLRDRFRHAH